MSLHARSWGDGPDLVLLHGWGLHSGVWKGVADALGERFRVHAVDLPGHGDSRGAAPGTLDHAADALDACVPPGSIVCGWSLGALVAMKLAARSRVRALALVSATPCFVERPDWPHALAARTVDRFENGIQENVPDTLERFMRLNALNGARFRETVRFLGETLRERALPERGTLRATLGWLRDADVRTEAASIGIPVRILHGARDAIAPVDAARWLARQLPHAELVEWNDAAHVPFFTHDKAFVRELEALRG